MRQNYIKHHVAKECKRHLKEQSCSNAAQPQIAIHYDLGPLIANSPMRPAKCIPNFADRIDIATSRSRTPMVC